MARAHPSLGNARRRVYLERWRIFLRLRLRRRVRFFLHLARIVWTRDATRGDDARDRDDDDDGARVDARCGAWRRRDSVVSRDWSIMTSRESTVCPSRTGAPRVGTSNGGGDAVVARVDDDDDDDGTCASSGTTSVSS